MKDRLTNSSRSAHTKQVHVGFRQSEKAAGLDDLVVCPGERSFTETGEPSNSFDLVVSEDSCMQVSFVKRASRSRLVC